MSMLSFRLIPWVALGLLAMGCGMPEPARRATDNAVDRRESDQPPGLVDGIPADTYYERFAYLTGGDDAGTAVARYLATPWAEVDGFARLGVLYAQTSLFLLPERQYALVYHEAFGTPAGTELRDRRTIARRVRRGTWRVSGTELLLGDAAVGRGTRKRGQPALSLTLREELGSGAARGTAETLLYAAQPEPIELRASHLLELPDLGWFTGEWVQEGQAASGGRDERMLVSPRPRGIEFTRHQDVGREPGAGVAAGTWCRYRTWASEIDLGARVIDQTLRWELSYRVDRIEAVADEANSPACAQYVARWQQTLLVTPLWDSLEFVTGEAGRLLTADRRLFVKR
jgi:hypothetical protein